MPRPDQEDGCESVHGPAEMATGPSMTHPIADAGCPESEHPAAEEAVQLTTQPASSIASLEEFENKLLENGDEALLDLPHVYMLQPSSLICPSSE